MQAWRETALRPAAQLVMNCGGSRLSPLNCLQGFPTPCAAESLTVTDPANSAHKNLSHSPLDLVISLLAIFTHKRGYFIFSALVCVKQMAEHFLGHGLTHVHLQAADEGKRRKDLPTESALEIANKAAQAASAAAADAAQVRYSGLEDVVLCLLCCITSQHGSGASQHGVWEILTLLCEHGSSGSCCSRRCSGEIQTGIGNVGPCLYLKPEAADHVLLGGVRCQVN